MSDSVRFNVGDRVRHRTRPEWGEGVVATAQSIAHNGGSAQRLVISFANHGRVTVNAAIAPIVPADAAPAPAAAASSTSGWLNRLNAGNSVDADALSDLPEDVTDPFTTLARRLRLTLDLYRFSREPRRLMDWAVAQSGLTDPLTRFSRNDLEKQFVSFEQARDAHLRSLLQAARKGGETALIDEAAAHPRPEARAAVARLLRTL